MPTKRAAKAPAAKKTATRAAKKAKPASQTASAPAKRAKRHYLPAQERRERIIVAAQKVFASSSLQGARTRDLARAAQINQATLFEHFESKEALFMAAVIEPLLQLMKGMRERAQAYEALPTREDVFNLARQSSQRHLETMVEIYPLLVAALFSDPALGKKLYREQIAPILNERTEAIRGLAKDGVDAEFVNLAMFGIFFAVAMDRSFTGKSGDLAEVARQATQLAAYGFLKDHN